MGTPVVDWIDGFAGGGGATEGITQAGGRVLLAANHWPTALDTHQRNHPDVEHRLANLSETDYRTFPTTAAAWWSPSCVGHAPAGGRKRPPAEVERLRADAAAVDRATAFAVIACAEIHRQQVIIIENVPEFRSWSLYPWFLDGLGHLGYRVEEMILDAADYGHAQRRKRLFIAATLPGVDLDLTPPAAEPVPASEILEMGFGRPITRRLYVTPQVEEIPAHLDRVPHLVMMRKHAHARRADTHALATITAGGNHHGIATLVDGVPHYRLLTNRECARSQGFPDRFEFAGKPADVKRQIGNAVPVGIARWFGGRVAAALGGQTPTAVAA